MRRVPTQGEQPTGQGTHPLMPYAPPPVPGATGAYTGAYAPGGPAAAGGAIPVNRHSPSFLGLLKALKRRWVLATFLGLLAGLAAAGGVWLALPTGKHQVRSLLSVEPPVSTVQGQSMLSLEEFETFKKNQEKALVKRLLLQNVVQDPAVQQLWFIAMAEDPAKWIEDRVRVKWDTPTIMNISFNGDNPHELKILLDVLVKKYLADAQSTESKLRQQQLESLRKQRDELQRKNQLDNDKLSLLATDAVIVPGKEGHQTLITLLEQQKQAATADMKKADREINRINKLIKENDDELKNIDAKVYPIDLIVLHAKDDPAIRERAAERDVMMAALERNMSKMKDPENSPLVRERRREIQALETEITAIVRERKSEIETRVKAALREELAQATAKLKTELTTQESYKTDAQTELAAVTSQLSKVTKSTILINEISQNIQARNERLLPITKRIDELETEGKGESRLSMWDETNIVMNHGLQQKIVFSAMSGLLGFAVILVIVALLEWRSRRVDSVDQVVNEVGMRVIGTIPAFPSRASLKAGDADQNQNWRFILNESVNSTRTMLLHAAKTQSMQVLMVTSATQGEGKTSLASQLATSMATAGLRTLILDGDLRNPSMHRLFDVTLTPGCSEILCQEVDVSEAVQPTAVPNLWMIPAGQCSNRVIAALAQGHPLETLFNRLRGQFDFIVVDCCPVLPVADALLIGQHVDGVVMSVLQDVSQLPKVLNATERLTQLNIPLLGAVVNGIKTDIHAYGYNYVKQLPA